MQMPASVSQRVVGVLQFELDVHSTHRLRVASQCVVLLQGAPQTEASGVPESLLEPPEPASKLPQVSVFRQSSARRVSIPNAASTSKRGCPLRRPLRGSNLLWTNCGNGPRIA